MTTNEINETATLLAVTSDGRFIVSDTYEGHSAFLNVCFGSKSVLDIEDIAKKVGFSKGDIFVDLGANVGQQIEPILSLGGIVHAFEPHPIIFSFLRDRHRTNKNVILNFAAADTENRNLPFYFKNNEYEINGGASLYCGKTQMNRDPALDQKPTPTCETKTKDISEYIESIPSRIKILKIDTEGTEYDLIQRLMETDAISKIDVILLEDHGGSFRGLEPWYNHAQTVLMNLTFAEDIFTKIILWNGNSNENATNKKLAELCEEFRDDAVNNSEKFLNNLRKERETSE